MAKPNQSSSRPPLTELLCPSLFGRNLVSRETIRYTTLDFSIAERRDEGRVPESKRESVILNGTLKGMGREVPCSVLALKVSLPQLNIFEYIRCDIHQAPVDLPDGHYSVFFEGRTMKVNKSDGLWQSRGLWLASDATLDGGD